MPNETERGGRLERAVYGVLRTWSSDFGAAVRFLTRVPWPSRPTEPTEPEPAAADAAAADTGTAAPGPGLTRAARAFPIVGALLGLVGGIVYAIAFGLGLPSLVAAILAIAAMALATGALHEDGLADMADGFGGGGTAADKLAIMRDSRIGAYGVIALVLALAAKVGALTDLESTGVVMVALIAAAASSRAVMPAIMAWMRPARADGLGASAGRPTTNHVFTGIAIAVVLSVVLLGWTGIVALLVCALGGFAVAWLARRQIGGHTGDVLGAAQQLAELFFLLALAAVR